VLVTTHEDANREALSGYASRNGITELTVPKTIIRIEKLPVLGSGKTDYAGIQQLAEQKLAKAA
jgi:acyl-[acyl-carrier-protein]-phospholipid O-acyltransferase / long-chain-fatty-acid--[acyl-carrier-protein] ligase